MRIRQLTVRYTADPSGATQPSAPITNPKIAAGILIPLLADEAQEVFIVLLTNAKGRLIGKHEIARGGLSSVEVAIRLIFRIALLTDAVGIVLAHNHPSGDPTPSQEDIALTRRTIHAAEIIGGITISDHIIIGDQRYYSLKEHGIL